MPGADRIKRDKVDRAYIIFALWQCEGFIIAADRAFSEAQSSRRAVTLAQSPNFFVSQQAFCDFASALNFAANLAKMLRPAETKASSAQTTAQERAFRLKRMLKIGKRDLAILQDAIAVRNEFEHVDERLDRWSETGGTLMMHAVSSDARHIARTDRFNLYNPITKELLMLTKRVKITRLYDVVWRVWFAAIAANEAIERRQGWIGSLQGRTGPR